MVNRRKVVVIGMIIATFFMFLGLTYIQNCVYCIYTILKNGESKWSFKGLTKYAISNITSFTTAPLQLITVFGSVLLLFLGGMSIQTLVRFLLGQSAEGFTTVILLLLLIGGSIMMALGIIGYYIARIYEEVKGRPRYIVSKKTDDK